MDRLIMELGGIKHKQLKTLRKHRKWNKRLTDQIWSKLKTCLNNWGNVKKHYQV